MGMLPTQLARMKKQRYDIPCYGRWNSQVLHY